MKNKKIPLKGYVKESDSTFLREVQANPKRAVNKRAIAKINFLLSDAGFKKSVMDIRRKPNIMSDEMEHEFDKEVYLLMKNYGYTRDWYNTFSSIVRDNTFSGIIEGQTIHIRDLNEIADYEMDDYKAVNPIAIFIKPDSTSSEVAEFVTKSWAKIQEIQRGYKTELQKPSIKNREALDIEKIILKNQDKTSKEIAEIVSNKFPSKGKKNAEITYGVNYIEKARTRLRKNLLNQ